jgi:hypothetical protein
MKPFCPWAMVVVGVLIAGCTGNPETAARKPNVSADNVVNLATLPHGSLLETGRTYSVQVKPDTVEKHTYWSVQNPPIPQHYAVGFEWLNLSNVSNPREGMWTFVVKDIERWHDPKRGGPMGTFNASYKCDVLRIENVEK